jgi:hypothetical protein
MSGGGRAACRGEGYFWIRVKTEPSRETPAISPSLPKAKATMDFLKSTVLRSTPAPMLKKATEPSTPTFHLLLLRKLSRALGVRKAMIRERFWAPICQPMEAERTEY